MAKAQQEISGIIETEGELLEALKNLSLKYGGAWVFSLKPFSKSVKYLKYQSPSQVPDHFHDLTQNTMAYQGKLRGFTRAAKVREQNRGLGSR